MDGVCILTCDSACRGRTTGSSLPRCYGGSGAQEMLELLGDYLEAVTEAAGGLPPMSLAVDGSILNGLMCAAFAGLLDSDTLSGLTNLGLGFRP